MAKRKQDPEARQIVSADLQEQIETIEKLIQHTLKCAHPAGRPGAEGCSICEAHRCLSDARMALIDVYNDAEADRLGR